MKLIGFQLNSYFLNVSVSFYSQKPIKFAFSVSYTHKSVRKNIQEFLFSSYFTERVVLCKTNVFTMSEYCCSAIRWKHCCYLGLLKSDTFLLFYFCAIIWIIYASTKFSENKNLPSYFHFTTAFLRVFFICGIISICYLSIKIVPGLINSRHIKVFLACC